MNRKKFLRKSCVGVLLTFAGDRLIAQTPAQDNPPPMPLSLVKEFVIAGHGDFAKVKSMLTEYSNLIYSKFDWGNGDYEAAIEGLVMLVIKRLLTFCWMRGQESLYIY